MPKRVLILSDYIMAPSFSPRLTSLIHYLSENGWQCTLATDNLAGQEFKTSLCPQVNMMYLPANLSSLCRIYKRLADKLFNARERQFSQLLATTFKPTDFDLIFCSTYYYFPLATAAKLSHLWHIPFIADVRDIAEQWGKTPYFTSPLPNIFGLEKLLSRAYEKRNIRRRNNFLKQATAVSTVSPWHQQFLQQQTSAPVSLIYNGFDEREFAPIDKPTSVFRIAFFGRLINPLLRRPEMLFDAVGQLIKENKIPPDKLSIDFYCEPEYATYLQQQAAKYGVANLLHLPAFIARSEVKNAVAETSILLALGAPASEQQHGILGTKVFEAIGSEKPFMLIPSDEDDLAKLIADTNIGIAARTSEDIKTFIYNIYKEWASNGFTRRAIRDKSRFTRRYQAQQFEQLFSSFLHE